MTAASALRRLLAVVMACLVAVTLGPWPPSSAGAQQPASGTEAFTRLASCLTDSKELLVLFLVDTSGSLVQTDPTAQRVVAARVALSGLEALSRSSGVAVEVQLAGFAVGYEPVGTWTPLTATTLDGVQRQVDTFATRVAGIDTDYYAALRGAQQQLAERTAQSAAAGGPPPCKAVLWFTDGRYEIADRLSAQSRQAGTAKDYAPAIRLDQAGSGHALEAAGRELLCGATPLIDTLRRDGTSLFFIALTSNIDATALDFVDALVTGTGGSVRCGQEGSVRTGARLDAANLGELLAAFDRAASEIGRGVRDRGSDETPACATTACPEGRRTFTVDEIIRRFHVLAAPKVPGVAMELRGPSGEPLRIEPGVSGSGALGDVAVSWQWASPTAVTLDAGRPASAAGWAGDWSVTFLAPPGQRDVMARTQIYLFGDLVPKLLAPSVLEPGRPAVLRIAIVGEADEAPRPDIGRATLDATVTDPATGAVTRLDRAPAPSKGRFAVRYPVPADAHGERVLTLSLTVLTAKGLALAPAEREVRIPVRVVAYPSVTLLHRRLPGITGSGTTRATVVVRGDHRAPGCVWMVGTAADGPAAAGAFAASAAPAAGGADTCVRVRPDQTRRLVVTIRPGHPAKGAVKGTVRLAAVSDPNPEPRAVELAYQFTMTGPVDAMRRLMVFLALLVGGVLAPVGCGEATRRWGRARRAGLRMSFPRWAWSRSVGRAGGSVGRWGLGLGGWARSHVAVKGWRLFLGWGGRLGGWARTRLVGAGGENAPWSVGGMIRRPRRRRPGGGGAPVVVDEWGVPLADDDRPRDRIHVSVLLDRSESMAPLVRHVVGGCNAFLAVHRAEPGPARLTLAQFDLQDPLEILLDGLDLAEAPDLTSRQFRPRGVTPLYDAIGALLDRTEDEARARADDGLPPEDQLVVVLTDGRDNASSRYSRTAIANRIRMLEARGWTFVFLGANQDAFAEGAALGIAAGSTSGFAATDLGVRKAWASISRATLAHRRKRSEERVADRLDFFRGIRDSEPVGARRRHGRD